jgi:plasmid stabilization system protein ParE
MNERHEIKYSDLFYRDLSSILNYIKYELENRTAANYLFDEIMKEISNRAYNPESYEKYFSTRKRKNTYYRIYVKNYTIFYVVRNNVMEVRRIIYSRPNLRNIM